MLGCIYHKHTNLCKIGRKKPSKKQEQTPLLLLSKGVGGGCYEKESNGDTAFKLQQRADSNKQAHGSS